MARTAVKAPPIPTLAERIAALREEVEAELDRLAELHRPKGEWKDTAIVGVKDLVGAVPAEDIRLGWMAKGGGHVFEAYLSAIKEFPQ
jgi:hypothetical protein